MQIMFDNFYIVFVKLNISGGNMKDKTTFLKNLSIVIVVALMGVLLIASYFIPVMGASKNYDTSSYSCRDVVVAMKAESRDDLYNEAIIAADAGISEYEGKQGKIIRAVGVLGMINAMIGAALLICAIATIFIKGNILRISSIAFAVAALCVSITIIALLCVYLGGLTELQYSYSYYYAIKAGSFVMMAASLFGGTGAWFLGFFNKEKHQTEAKEGI